MDKVQIDPKYIIRNYRKSGKDYVTYPGLLDAAWNNGLRKIATNVVSDFVCAAHAAIGAVNARPTSTVTGMARTPYADSTAPNAARTGRRPAWSL